MWFTRPEPTLGVRLNNLKSHDISSKYTYTRLTRTKGQLWLFGGSFGTHRSLIMSQEHLGSHMVVCQGRTNLRNEVERFEIS